MSLATDTIITSTQTIEEKDEKQYAFLFDENERSYQIFAWHCCQIASELDQQLIILVKEDQWLGTLTTTIENQSLVWKNTLNHRQHQLRLSEEDNSIITHFQIQEVIDRLFI